MPPAGPSDHGRGQEHIRIAVTLVEGTEEKPEEGMSEPAPAERMPEAEAEGGVQVPQGLEPETQGPSS